MQPFFRSPLKRLFLLSIFEVTINTKLP